MTRIRVSARFLLRGVWVQPEALGESFAWGVDGHLVTLVLPEGQADFVRDDEPEVAPVAAWVPTARIEGSGEAVEVQVVAVDVQFDGDISAADKVQAQAAREAGNEEPASEFAHRAQGLWGSGHEVAERVVHLWLRHVRVVSAQPWLGIAVEVPLQHGRSHIFDAEADMRLMSFGPTKSLTIRSGQLALSLEQLGAIEGRTASGEGPATAETLLADARFLAQEAETVDAQRAVLIAAAACEMKAKLTMREKVNSEKSDLLGLVLTRISNLPQLLDEPLKAALGTSLKAVDRPLYDKVAELSQRRNHVVHRGAEVDQAEGSRLVHVAVELFAWLDAL